MPRLATAALIAWLAIPGGAAPAIACASPNPGDCCPAMPAGTCSGQVPLPDPGARLLCCPAAPGAPALVSSPAARAELANPAASGDPDRDPPFVSDARVNLRSAKSCPSASPARGRQPDGRATYLYTARLRL